MDAMETMDSFSKASGGCKLTSVLKPAADEGADDGANPQAATAKDVAACMRTGFLEGTKRLTLRRRLGSANSPPLTATSGSRAMPTVQPPSLCGDRPTAA
jgi:hypothetical protein